MTSLIHIQSGAATVGIEYRFIDNAVPNAPLIVFLHEGLGSVAMWRDFPDEFCVATGARGLVYSRPGYGKSTPRRQGERWGIDFMHAHARDVLPALLRAIGVDVAQDKPWLFGHSDGGSIALIHASLFPLDVSGVIVAAPHIYVEDVSVTSIEKTREIYLRTDLRSKLARYHDDVDSAFWGWNEVWLDPAFRAWTIEPMLPQIVCPLLAIQGLDDEYGTMAQIQGIASALPHTTLVKLDNCGHSPHRDQPQAVIDAAVRLIRN